MKRSTFIMFCVAPIVVAAFSNNPALREKQRQVRLDEMGVPVTITWVNNKKFGLKGHTILTIKDGKASCTITAPGPRDRSDKDGFITLGHEFMHCFRGDWHADDPNFSH